ncbi:hypothetical protein ANN_24781 [Periplaneta americana]|uniref:Uncharacterized protein n=1 Tax=Periplaneta americana TaxID=6978 RepID=A0ABQ8RZW3_PERAM|nr:hypothetical protein ANN_24781 [Periplaneta americana]
MQKKSARNIYYDMYQFANERGYQIICNPYSIVNTAPLAIDLVWAQVKHRVARRHSTFKIVDIERLVHEELDHLTQRTMSRQLKTCRKQYSEGNLRGVRHQADNSRTLFLTHSLVTQVNPAILGIPVLSGRSAKNTIPKERPKGITYQIRGLQDFVVSRSPQQGLLSGKSDSAPYISRGGQARGKRIAVAPRFPPEEWDVYESTLHGHHRTNNIVEVFHWRFQRIVSAHYVSIWRFLNHCGLKKKVEVRTYETVILPVVLYCCETCTLTLREEQRLRVFENKVLRKIFGAKRDEVTGERRKLHNAELRALYSSPNLIRNIKSRRLRWAGHVARMDESRNAYRVLVGSPEGKIPFGRSRRTWKDNIKMDLREVRYDYRVWINLGQDTDRWRAFVRASMNLRAP